MNPEEEKNSSYADGQEMQTPEIEADEATIEDTSDSNCKDAQINDIPKGAEDKELYNEVLEKLDIQKKTQNEDSQEKSTQEKFKQQAILNKLKNLEQAKAKQQIQQSISQDFVKIQKLMKAGLINSAQEQNLKKQVLKKAFDKLVQTEKIKRNLLPALQQKNLQPQATNTLEEFARDNSEFFTQNGRKEVLDYLKSGNAAFGKDELNKISEIIRLVEKSAIDRYLQKITHEKTLKEGNETAKKKLTANAQKTGHNGNLSKSFTRDQIGKMSSAEFTKYEPYIMEQLKKGLIK